MRLCFTLFGSRYTYGLAPAGATPIFPAALLQDVARRGLHGLEVPSQLLDGQTEADLRSFRSQAEQAGIALILMTSGTDPDHLRRQLRVAAAIGSPILGTSAEWTKFGGDRREFAGRWSALVAGMRDRLAAALPEAERLGIHVGLENHQDFTSAELLQLCDDLQSPRFGVVFDTANGLGVVEHPMDFAKAVLPRITYVHLKDYRLYWSDAGYKMVRCAVGAGDVPLGELVGILAGAGKTDLATVEIGALVPREVRVLAPDFWADYPKRPQAVTDRAMELVRRHARPKDQDTRTPYELGAAPAAIAAFEEAELRDSIRNAARWTGEAAPLAALESAGAATRPVALRS